MTDTRPASPATAPSTRLRRARLAVIATFFACGFAMAAWVVHIPRIMRATGLDEAGLGVLLLVLGAGALVAMQVGGSMTARYGSAPVQFVGSLFMVGGVFGTALAPDPVWLGVALLGFGLGNGSVDLAMNEQAVRVEQGYGRPIMGSFHAFFSVGGAVGALVGGWLLSLQIPVSVSVGLMAALSAVGCLAAVPQLFKGPPGLPESGATAGDAAAPAVARAHVLRLGLILALLAFGFFLSEGTVNDWSARHAVEHLGTSDSLAAAAFGVFSTAMTIGRFAADKISGRFGAVAVVRYGAALAAAGILLVVLVPSFPVVVVGWGLYGLGLSGIVPQLFTAAGSLVPGPRGAVVLARVVGAGYVGMLAGPALVGWLAALVGLNQALLLPFVFCLLGVALSFTLPGAKKSTAA